MMDAAASGEVGGGVGVGLETQAERVRSVQRIAERMAANLTSCQTRERWSCGWCGGTRALVLG